MKYPCIRVAEWDKWESSTKGVVKHRLVVHFVDKHSGKVLFSTDPRYEVGKTYNDFRSAENSKKWRSLREGEKCDDKPSFVVISPFECMRLGLDAMEGEDVGFKPGDIVPGEIVHRWFNVDGQPLIDIEDERNKVCGVPEHHVMPAEDYQKLCRIAANHLGFMTLETRKSDRLDFQSVSVCSVREALQLAYQAGRDAERIRALKGPVSNQS